MKVEFKLSVVLPSSPIGTHSDNYFSEPDFFILPEARRKHLALFGGTGTGKSNLLNNMASADLAAGTGITVVDPHGDLVEGQVENHIPRSRKNDVIYFNPVLPQLELEGAFAR